MRGGGAPQRAHQLAIRRQLIRTGIRAFAAVAAVAAFAIGVERRDEHRSVRRIALELLDVVVDEEGGGSACPSERQGPPSENKGSIYWLGGGVATTPCTPLG